MSNIIIETLGLQHLSAPEQESFLRKLAADSFVLKRAQELSLSQFILPAVQSFLPLERHSLAKRCGAYDPKPQPAIWSISEGHDQNGDYWGLTASCLVCRTSSTANAPQLVWSGGRMPRTSAEVNAVINALSFQHCGRKDPASLHVKEAWRSVLLKFLPAEVSR